LVPQEGGHRVAGASAILDAPYGHQEDRDELARIAADADVRLIECLERVEVYLGTTAL
jgi:predicted kinase